MKINKINLGLIIVFFAVFSIQAQAPLQPTTSEESSPESTEESSVSNCISGDCQNGLGTIVFEDGNRYEGSFQEGKFEGNGVFKFSNGDVYTGELKDSTFSGKGTYVFGNGDKFVGTFVDGYFKAGTLTTAKGNKYIGGFFNNLMHGVGTLYGNADKVVYRGKWVSGLPAVLLAKKGGKEGETPVYRALPAKAKDTSPPDVILTIKDTGKTINLIKGQQLVVQLYTNVTTGYTWSSIANPDDTTLQLVSNVYIPYRVPELVGKGGIAKWIYKAMSPGETKIEFNYTRAWLKAVTSHFKVNVVVK